MWRPKSLEKTLQFEKKCKSKKRLTEGKVAVPEDKECDYKKLFLIVRESCQNDGHQVKEIPEQEASCHHMASFKFCNLTCENLF